MTWNLIIWAVLGVIIISNRVASGSSFEEAEVLELNFDNGNGQDFKLDEQMAQRVRAIIRHFKQDDPKGLPSGMDHLIQDPMEIPDMEQKFSGTKMKFENLSLYGLSKFRLKFIRVMLSDLKGNDTFAERSLDNGIAVGLSIDELFVDGFYQMSSWFSKSKGNFSVTISEVVAEAEVSFAVDTEGILQVETVDMDVSFGDLKMNFENLGFLASMFQGMINSVGGFLFDSIKPMILDKVEGRVRGELNRQARSVPQQFPNSINPIDMFLASARVYMRKKGLDPFPIPEYETSSWPTFSFTQGLLHGLSTIHRTGAILVNFEENIVRVTLHLGAENLEGEVLWKWNLWRNLIKKEGTLKFTIEYINVHVEVGQPANLDKPTTIDKIDLELGNIAVLSDGIGTVDYVVEAIFNILPNVLRKQIVDSLGEPLREYIQEEVQKALEIEKMIEERLPQ